MEYFFPLKERREIAEGTCAFWLETSCTDFSFTAGQYAAFTLGEETKVFTLASSPHHKDFIMFTTRMRPSPFKEDLRELPLGTKIKVSAARGRFVLPESPDRPVAMIAGGIGVTPFHSMIEWAAHAKTPHRLILFYSNRTLKLTAFLKEFQEWERQNSRFKLVATLTRENPPDWKYETGRLNEAMLKKYLTDLTTPIYYVAGPPHMVEEMKQILLGLSIPADQIKIEKFSGY